ncbi:MAG: hypothetical protein ACFCVE_09035 [Phycisphaerae bacterium]
MIKLAAVGVVGAALVGGIVFGDEVASYAGSGFKQAREAVKGEVPVEFEIERARDLVDEILPEMHAHVRMIAEQEVEIEHLRADIAATQARLADQKQRVARLRDALQTEQTTLVFDGVRYERSDVAEDLARSFEAFKEAEVILAGKERMLENRQKSLAAAVRTLEKTRQQKHLLEGQIATLEAQHQLVRAAGVGSEFAIDDSKVQQTQKLIREIKKKLDVAERVLAHEAHFTEGIRVETLDEDELVREVNERIGGGAF